MRLTEPSRQTRAGLASISKADEQKLLESTGSWPVNAPPPVPLSVCRRIVECADSGPRVHASEALEIAKLFLRSNWPWLAKTGQDLEGYLANLGILIEGSTEAAVRHVINPKTGPDWEGDRPPTPQAFRRELAAYEERQRGLVRAAERILAEAERRAAEAERDRQIEADRPKILDKLKGRSPLQAIIDEAGK